MLFMFLFMLNGPAEESYGLAHVRKVIGVSRASVSNIFYHFAGSLHSSFKSLRPAIIEWPDAAFRASTRGLINGFPGVVVFVDGSKQRAWRPQDPVLQEFVYDGHRHFRAYTVRFWCDVFGRCCRLDFTLSQGLYA